MESSYSEDEEDRSSVQRRSQMDRLAREEAFYRFVSNLSEEDYKLMRDNNLLATVGESTEEELMRRLQQIKEHPPQELGEGNSSESMSSDDSILQWLTTFRQTENMTEWEQGDNHSWTSASSSNSSSSDFGCSGEMNFNPLNGNPNRQNGHLTFARLLEGQYIENRQRQVEYPPSESTDTSSSISEENATEAFMEVPPTRGQRRSRSRSPETRRTRPRIERSSPPNRQHEMLMRFHYCTSPETFEYIQINEPGIFARVQQIRALRGQITRPELQSWDLHSASATRNAFQEEYSSDTASDNESEEFKQTNPTTLENGEREVENPPSESIVRRSSISDGSVTEAIMEVPPTRGQRRSRSRSPETRRTRPRIESSSPPNRQHEMLMRFHYRTSSGTFQCIQVNEPEVFARIQQNEALREQITRPELQSQDLLSASATRNAYQEEYSPDTANDNESEEFKQRNPTTLENREREVENPPSESVVTRSPISDGSATEVFLEVPPSRGQRRSRSRSPETRRTRPRIESSSPPNRQHEMLMRFHYYTSPETFEYILINEPGIFARIQPSGAVREQITRPELQSQDLLSASATRNALQEEYSSDTVSDNESEGFRQRYPTTLFDDEVTNHPGEYSLRNSIASRTQLISETTNNTVTLESYQEELRNRLSPFEQESMRSSVNTIIIPAPIANETTLWHMTEFDESSELMDSESQLESSSSPLNQHMEKEESQNGRDDSSSSIISSSNSNPSCDSRSNSPAISGSSSSYVSSSSPLPTSNSSSSNENSEIISVMFDGFNEINTSSSSPSQPRQESQYTTPATSDESDSWPFLAHFFILNEAHNQPTGLTKQQIDNFAVRNFGKDGALKACSICLTEFKESNKIRILPCSHEYHIHCIDRWLSENSTCPVCRRELTDSDGRKNSS
ncbi:E3 ubiquitin-protein ligase RLIM [Sciurus carolinensis]|uniref:RING-type E3 ubiquitin transferase n=1 Tax=Sciurus carolinensis TaxID=30640 RepID=A0AA41SZN1_SCICA|nr:E3 ubiquitin-protein ligase RLIM [Sciurus carolinensis]